MKRQFLLIGTVFIILILNFFIQRNSSHTILRGDQYLYDYHSEGIGYSDIDQLYSSDTINSKYSFFRRATLQVTRYDIKCKIKRTIMKSKPEFSISCYEIVDPLVVIENGGLIMDIEKVKAEITAPFFCLVNSNGNIFELHQDSTISYLSSNIQKDIVGKFQFVRSIKDDRKWKVEEENTTGTFIANYQWLKDSSSLSIYEKKNSGYIQFKSIQKNENIRDEGSVTLVRDSFGVITKILGSESSLTLFNSDTISASANRISASLLSKISANKEYLTQMEIAFSKPTYRSATKLSGALSEDEINRLAYKTTLGTDTWDMLFSQLADPRSQTPEHEDSLTIKFRSLCYLFPENCRKIATLLIREPIGTFRFNVLSRALSITGSSDAADAFTTVVENRIHNEDVMIELLPFYATSIFPSDKALAFIKKIAFDDLQTDMVRSTAQLALGGMTFNLRKINEAKAEETANYLLSKIENEKDTLQKLLVIGNTGSPTIIPLLRMYYNNKNIGGHWRVAAVNASRLIKHEEVSLLLNNLLKDKDSLVINAAKETIQFRKEYFDSKQK